MLNIDKKLTERQLSHKLYQLKHTEVDNLLLDILYRLVKDNLFSLTPFENIQITKEEITDITISEYTNNTELLARWYDLMQYFKINVSQNCLLAYNYYMSIYAENKQWKYAFRAFLM